MVKLTVIANCQAGPVGQFIAMASSAVELATVSPVYLLGPGDTEAVLATVAACDIVVHQPIGTGFGPIASATLRERFPDKIYVSFPSIYFSGLLPQISYLRASTGKALSGPFGDYHNLRVLRAYAKGLTPEACLAALAMPDFDVADHFRRASSESRARDRMVDIPVMDMLEARIHDAQATFTFNHPDNAVLWHVATETLRRLGLPQDGAPTPPKAEALGVLVAAVPPEVTETLGTTWSNPVYRGTGKVIEMPDFVQRAYRLYDAIPDIAGILELNRARFSLPVL